MTASRARTMAEQEARALVGSATWAIIVALIAIGVVLALRGTPTS